MRFRIATLVLSIALILLLVGWAVDRHNCRVSHQKVLTEHITGNVNIQSAVTRSELASDYFADPSEFADVIEERLLYDIYRIWRYREFIDTAFSRRSPGNTAVSLAHSSLAPLNYSSAKEYFDNASRIGMLGKEHSKIAELSDMQSIKYRRFHEFVDLVFEQVELHSE